MKRPARSPAIDYPPMAEHSPEDSAAAALIATWPVERPGLVRLLQCRLLHRADWEYLGTRQDQTVAPWPVDSYRCERCDRAWEKIN